MFGVWDVSVLGYLGFTWPRDLKGVRCSGLKV